jgi:hypothetical protein
MPAGHYVVDTSVGDDSATGSVACPFKTLTHALAAIGSPTTATTIDVIGSAILQAPAETLPFVIPANTTVSGPSGTPITVLVPAGASAFRFGAAASGVANFSVDGNAKMAMYGIQAGPGAAATLENVAVKDTQLAGINVTGGQLSLVAGVTVTGAGMDPFGPRAAGLRVSGTGATVIRGTVAAPTRFFANTGNGIEVADRGSVDLVGTPMGTTGTGTVVVSDNFISVNVSQTPSTPPPPQNRFDGLVSVGSTTYDGLLLVAGSNVKVRNSVLLMNARSGIAIYPWATTGMPSIEDVSNIDLGKAGDPGKNVLQATSGGNALAGICLGLDAGTATLSAEGNLFAAGNCGSASATLSAATTCAGGVDVAVTGAGNLVDAKGCTCATACSP